MWAIYIPQTTPSDLSKPTENTAIENLKKDLMIVLNMEMSKVTNNFDQEIRNFNQEINGVVTRTHKEINSLRMNLLQNIQQV